MIRVELETSPTLRLRAVDDGSGFDEEALPAREHRFGLTSMRERAESLGARSASSRGSGATVVRSSSRDSAVTVLIADDYPPTLRGVRLALEQGACRLRQAGDAGAWSTRRFANAWISACSISTMPGNGNGAAAQISRQLPQAAIVMLTVSRDDRPLFDALRAGASGYLLKDIDPARLQSRSRARQGEAELPRGRTRLACRSSRTRAVYSACRGGRARRTAKRPRVGRARASCEGQSTARMPSALRSHR